MLASNNIIPLTSIDDHDKVPSRIKQLTAHVTRSSVVKHADVHLIQGRTPQLFVANGSQLKPITPPQFDQLQGLINEGAIDSLNRQLHALGFNLQPAISGEPVQSPATHALSLAIAQKCNMGCSYCYAEQGDFGGTSKSMPLETAKEAIDLLLCDKSPGERVTLSFMGGEPLTSRKSIIAATEYADKKSQATGIKVNFSITTNGTLVTPEDAVFFEQYGFAVTVSIDGSEQQHNQLRPMKNGSGSYQRIMQRIEPLLALQHNMQVSARVTVTPNNLDLVKTLDDLIGKGFHSVGFSPLLKSSNGQGEMSQDDLQRLLQSMIACGIKFEENVLQGKRYPFLNMVNAHKEIGKATHRPYPCGAGAGYMGVSADGDLSACHRFVNDDKGYMGSLKTGVNPDHQNEWLSQRHVDQQTPCNQCWARYLCAGSCHHEVIDRGRIACDYIRGWLYFCLQSYGRLNQLAPRWMH